MKMRYQGCQRFAEILVDFQKINCLNFISKLFLFVRSISLHFFQARWVSSAPEVLNLLADLGCM